MILVIDHFPFKVFGQDISRTIPMNVESVPHDQIGARLARLLPFHEGRFISLIETKKNCQAFTKALGVDVPLFAQRMFTVDDYLTISPKNVFVYGEWDKTKKCHFWYLIGMDQNT